MVGEGMVGEGVVRESEKLLELWPLELGLIKLTEVLLKQFQQFTCELTDSGGTSGSRERITIATILVTFRNFGLK